MKRIEREQRIIGVMIRLYCRHHHGKGAELCDECRSLLEYACGRLERCRHGEAKGSCRRCLTHCYHPDRREAIRRVMRWAGPRMIFYCPLELFKHL